MTGSFDFKDCRTRADAETKLRRYFEAHDAEQAAQARADMIDHGAAPSHVAEVVYQAIVDNQFFVFPTRDLDALVEARLADIRQGMAWRDEHFS